MSLLLLRSVIPPDLDPPTRPRSWWALVFKLIEPSDRRMTPEEALAIVLHNWHRSYAAIKRNGVELPG